MTSSTPEFVLTVTVGFALGERGDGVAYASLAEADGSDGLLVRVGFRCRPLPALHGRDVVYAALDAVATVILRRPADVVVFRIDDEAIVADRIERRSVPAALAIPYVRLGCTLNRFRATTLVAAADRRTRDLTARAQAEATLQIAA